MTAMHQTKVLTTTKNIIRNSKKEDTDKDLATSKTQEYHFSFNRRPTETMECRKINEKENKETQRGKILRYK